MKTRHDLVVDLAIDAVSARRENVTDARAPHDEGVPYPLLDQLRFQADVDLTRALASVRALVEAVRATSFGFGSAATTLGASTSERSNQ